MRRSPHLRTRPRPGFNPSVAVSALERLEERVLLTAYVVDTLSDVVAADGHVSLREAIQAANTNSAVNEAAAGNGSGFTDTVRFAQPLWDGVITLSGSELLVTDHLAIHGSVTISGDSRSRVLEVAAGTTANFTGLTLAYGGGGPGDPQSQLDRGGALYNAGNLSLAACTFTVSRANFGGGVFNAAGASLVAESCIFSNTTANDGAAIGNDGVVALTESDLLYCDAAGSTLANTAAGIVNVENSLFDGNVGGGISNAGEMTVKYGRVFASSSVGIGNTGWLKLSDVTVTKNGSFGITNQGTLQVALGRITENADTGLRNVGQADVFEALIYGNAAPARSGVPRWNNTGGGVFNGGNDHGEGTLTLRDCTVSQNAGRAGGGIYNWRGGVATVSNCQIIGNAASVPPQSAGIGDNAGGGIFNIGTLTVLGSVVSKNAADRNGGGIYDSRTDGSGVLSPTGTLVVADSLVAENAAGSRGGGVAVSPNAGSAVITRCAITGNTAVAGGGVSNEWSLEVYNSTVSGNYAAAGGGGLNQTGFAALYNVTVFGNRAGSAGGGLNFEAPEFPSPPGPPPPGGFGYRVVNTIVAGNRRGTAGNAGTPDDVSASLGTGSHHDLIGDAATAGGLINGVNNNVVGVDWRTVLDGVLRNNGGPTPTHALIAGSPAIDHGTDVALPTDQRGVGFPRKVGAAVDIGAFEFQPTAAAASGSGSLATFWAKDDAFDSLLAAV